MRNLFDKRGEQTIIKHHLLESYLRAWAIIIRKHFPKAYYIDAFAGIGEYKTGEEGSPIIAAKILLEEQKTRCNFNIKCIEKSRDRAKLLEKSISKFKEKLQIEVIEGEFTKNIDPILNEIGDLPAFILIDPSGFSGLDFEKIGKILSIPRKEILINFMWNAIQRWMKDSKLQKTLTALFGTDKWMEITSKNIPSKIKERKLLDLYVDQLKKTDSFAWPFQNKFPDKERTFYYLIYATKNLTGFKIMKDVMFREKTKKYFIPSLLSGIEFSEFTNNINEIIYVKKKIDYNSLLAYTLQETPYLNKDLKNALKELESEGKIIKIGNYKNHFYKPPSNKINPLIPKSSSFLDNSILVHTKTPIVENVRIKFKEYEMLDSSKKTLVQQVGDGSIIKRFDKTPIPRKPIDIICPHFLELKWGYGCPYNCSWCYLKGTFRFLPTGTKPVVKDYDKIKEHVNTFLGLVSTKEVLNTGEIADSLMEENSPSPFSKFIIPIFEKQDIHKVLFLTKSDNIKNILSLPSHNQVIMSFSVNAIPVSRRWERGAPKNERRIKAAKKLFEKGYEVRLRIDPMVPVKNWQKYYLQLLENIFKNFVPERITVGSLRGLQSTINSCTDKTWIKYLKESSNWGKKIDFRTRYAMYSTIIQELKNIYNFDGVSLCKESIKMWKALRMDYKAIKCNCVW